MNSITHTRTTSTRGTRLIGCVLAIGILVFLGAVALFGPVATFAASATSTTVTFMLEKKLSDVYPVGYAADQFSFTVSGYSTPVTLVAFNVDSANGTIDLPVGTYTLAEVGPVGFVPAEWTVQWSGAGCANQSGPATTITVEARHLGLANFGCRADNQWRHGNLRVIKEVVGTTTPYENFSFTVTQGATERFAGPFETDGTNDIVLGAGAYTVTEASYPNYTTTYSAGCTDTLAQGGSKTCTITNTYNNDDGGGGGGGGGTGTIVIEKQTVPDGNQTAFTFNPSWSDTDIILRDGERSTSTVLIPGTYSIVETASTTWTQSGVVCSDGSSLTTLVLSVGETLTCVVTNTKDDSNNGGGGGTGATTGTIVIEKQTVPDGNQTPFTFNPSWSETDIVLRDGEQSTSTVLIPGTYSIVETVSATWTQSGFVCSDGSSLAALVLSAGETLTCVVTNTRDDSNGGGGSNGGSNGGGGGSSGGGNSGGSNGEGNNSGSQNSTRVADPQPLVLGEATSVMPLGAANTGAGGTALPQVPAPLLVVLAGEAIVKIRLRLGRW